MKDALARIPIIRNKNSIVEAKRLGHGEHSEGRSFKGPRRDDADSARAADFPFDDPKESLELKDGAYFVVTGR